MESRIIIMSIFRILVLFFAAVEFLQKNKTVEFI